MKNTGIKILLLCMIAFPLQAQQLNWQPDEFWKINHSADIQSDPNGSPYTYGDVLQATTQDKWNDMQSNPNWQLSYLFKSVSNIIKVSVNHEQLLISDSYKYRLDLQIKGYTTPGGSQQTKNISLVIEYDKDSGAVYNDLSLFKLEGTGFHTFETRLMDVVDLNQSTPTTVPRASLAKNFDIETKIIVQRYDKKLGFMRVYSKMLSPVAPAIDVWWEFLPGFPSSPSNCNGTLYRTCYTPLKPMMYELEWTFVDNYGYNLASGAPTNPNPTQVSYDFKNNSTRIITSQPCYSIPNIYERGFVVFRVRTIRPSPDNFSKLEYSPWSLPQDAGSINLNGSDCAWQYVQAVAAHEADEINWQYSVSFAEEGKHKRVVNYFDGAGYNRQTQTKINSDNNYTIAADKIYDYEGRPAIQTLPIPVWSDDLNYKPNLSINKATNAPYKAADFDEGCNHDSIPPLKETSLAALYYSPANPHQEGIQKFVPDAQGYPFAETMYSPDNTNKVLWQGGAGYSFQRWNGHGTRYVYVRAGQNEINRLLGTESGFYEYYPKQIVIDPNHQANYTIFNPEGKVVATALTGAPPSSSDYPVQALPDLPVPSGVSTELLAGISQQVDNGMRRAEHSFYAEAAGLNKLRYDATVPVYDPQCGNEYLKVQAHYNIKVVDECGNVPLEQNGTVGGSNEIVTAATPVTFNGTEFSETLDPDKYTIVKSLYFPDTAMQRLSRQFVSNHIGYEDCYLTQDSFIRKTVEAAAFPCAVSDTPTTCEMRKRQMMDDLYPGGKYGQYIQNSEGNFGGEVTNNSIFSRVTELGSINNNNGIIVYPVEQTGGLYAMTMLEPQYIVSYVNLAALNSNNFIAFSDSVVGGKKLLVSFQVLMPESQLKTLDSVRLPPHDGADFVYAAGPYGNTTVNSCPTCELIPEYDEPVNPSPNPPQPPVSNYACKVAVYYIYPTILQEDLPSLDGDGGTGEMQLPGANNDLVNSVPFMCPGRYDTFWVANESQIPATYDFEANEDGNCGGVYQLMFYEVLWCGDTSAVEEPQVIDTFYRYQAPCLTSDPIVTVMQTITVNGNTFSMYIDIPLSNATPDQLIAGFNDEIAEALLPLHPEYCKLLLCETGDFETKLEYIDSFAEAQALQLHTLSGILAQDPLSQAVSPSAPFTAAELSYYGIDASLTGANAGLLRRIDTMALEKAYCGCSSVEPYLYCKEAEYRAAINSMSMPNTPIKNLFFQNLRSSYLANRNLLKQKAFDGAGNACAPCSEWRMHLIAPPVFPSFFNAAGSGILSPPDPALAPWQAIINQGINGTTPNYVPAQVQATATAWAQEMNVSQVNEIMESLRNCGLSIPVSNSIANTLLQVSAAAYGAGITPQMVKTALVQNGVSLTDLCNPFLAEYGIYDVKKYKPHSNDYVNKSAGFYSGLQSFLNRTAVNNALVNASPSGSSVYTVNLDISGNLFEKELGALLGAGSADNVGIKGYYTMLTIADNYVEGYYKLALTFGSQSDTLFLSNRKLTQPAGSNYPVYSSTLTPQTDIPNTLFSSFSQVHSVLDDDKVVVPEKGYIAPYGVFCRYNKTMLQNINGTQTSVQRYSFYNVWSRNIRMLNPKEPDAPDYCLSCIAVKNAVKDYYGDAFVYALPTQVNHPYFERMFTNYLNNRLGRRHHFEEYERLMKGCALSNILAFPAAKATLQAVFTGDAAADAYLGSLLAAYPDVNVQHFRFKKAGTNQVVVWFDLNSVPWEKLKGIKQHISANASGVTYLPAGATAEVFVRQSCAATPSFANATVSSEDVSLKNFNNTYTPYKRYLISAINTEPEPVSDLLQAVEDYYNDPQNCRAGYMVTNAKLYRSDDYDNSVKQDFLSYIYAMDGYGEEEALANLAPAKLRENIPSLSGLLLSYDDTWCRNVKEDLYYYSMPAGSDPGWQRLSGILTKVRGALGNNELFPAAAVTNVSMSGSSIGNALKIFKMADGGVWYRLFAGEAKMYNVYLYPSERMAYPAADYSFVTSTGSDPNPVPLPGTGGMYRFKVHMKQGTHYVDCEGFTDFPFGSAGRLENVVLYDNQNQYQCIDTLPCERQVLFSAMEQGRLLHGAYIDSLAQSHFLAMKQFFPAHAADELHFTTQQMQHHYTLYYYDLAGNLTRTVPPAGVQPLGASQDADVNAARSSASAGTQLTLKPAHAKISTYKYNSLNQLTWQETPDGGITEFFYDPAGRLVFSQNARQRPAGKYSYTLYDPQGRITETGAFMPATSLLPLLPGQHPQQILQSSSTQADVIAGLVHSKPREDVVATIYDHAFLNLGNIQGLSPQQNLRKRVSAILYAPVVAQSNTIESYYAYATHFSYDAAGNVSALVHDNPYMDYMGQRFKRIDYDYDLLSGKVNMLSYNRGLADQIYHRYRYDADNRIIKAESSRDGLSWDRDAAYEYYKHGPLAQVSIGDLQVQSLQYAYTIQGWLKALNGDVLNPGEDMGKNGENGGLFPSDVMSHALDYYAGDYKPIGNTPVTHTLPGDGISRSLYNGNIARQTTAMAGMANLQRDYEYDQLNRIKQTVYSSMDHITHAVSSLGNAFMNTYAYDPDGNITALTRRDAGGSLMDNFTYGYYNAGVNNRLSYVSDAAGGGSGSDLQPGQYAGNYGYDPSGNLTKDVQEGIKRIEWNLYGKVSHLTKGTAEDDTMELFFSYDGSGQRVRKDYIRPGETPGVQERVSDIYVRDAAGNILSVYKSSSRIDGGSLIEWINDQILSQDGGSWLAPQGWGLASFLSAQFGSNGSFAGPVLDYALGNDAGWVQQQTDLGTGFYLAHSAGLLLQAVAEPKLEDYLDPLQQYTLGQAGALMLIGSNGPELLYRLWNEGSGRALEIKASFLSLYAASPPTADSLLDILNLPYKPGDPFDKRAELLAGYAIQYPAATLQACASLQDSMGAGALSYFRSALLSNPLIKKWVLDRKQESLAGKLQRALAGQEGGARDTVLSFFTEWLPDYDEDWLKNHATPLDQLNIVYESNRTGLLVGFLDQFGIAPVNGVLAGIQGLTGTAYTEMVSAAVLTGSLNPSYNPPQVNTPDPDNLLGESMYLAEHHLYGSSRLGIRHYDSMEYRAIYDQEEAGLTVTTLNQRRPWYSYSQSDWIKKDKVSEFTGATYNFSIDTLRERRWIGRKEYELTDHLGNVLVTFLDRKTGYGNANGNYVGFNADIASITDYYPYGMTMPGRSVAHKESRFGYGNHEKLNEVSGIGNTIDMGDRWLDTRTGRTPRTDLHENKYPSISPYSYAANSPIAFNDPDGKDYRLSIIKNNQGKTQIVSAHATVYLQGAGASQEMANKLNKEFQDKYAGFRKVNGVNVAFDVVYVYDADNMKNEKNLKNGQNIFNVRTDLEQDYRSRVYGGQDLKGTKFYTGNRGTINSKSSNLTKTVIHETLHMMGLSDRYDEFKNNLYTGSDVHKGFDKDIMGGGDKISDVHYENLLNHANTKDEDYTIQDNERYDRASQTDLKNGNKPNTQYHERSTQVQGE